LNKEAQFKQRNGLTEDAVDVDDGLGQFSETECLLMKALVLSALRIV
jgi:hypothetical protein